MKVREVMVVGIALRVTVVVFVRAGKGAGVIGGKADIAWIWLLLFVVDLVSIEGSKEWEG